MNKELQEKFYKTLLDLMKDKDQWTIDTRKEYYRLAHRIHDITIEYFAYHINVHLSGMTAVSIDNKNIIRKVKETWDYVVGKKESEIVEIFIKKVEGSK